MSNSLDRRLTALERAAGVSRVVWRVVFGAEAEAAADTEPRLEQAVSSPETMHARAGAATLADTITRQFPEGVPPNGMTVIAYRWADGINERD